MKLIMTLLAKDEADIIEDNILFHKSMGVDGFIVTDNNSSDGTREIFQKYKELGIILEIIDEPETMYYQAEWVNRMIEIATNKYHADWIIPSDADEFWYSPSLNLKNEINSFSEHNLLKFYHKNSICTSNDKYFTNIYFIQNHFPDFSYNKLKINNERFKEHRVYPKVIFKACDYKSITQGQHDCQMHNKKVIFPNNIVLYHFSIRNYSLFERKTINGGKACINHPNPKHGGKWRHWYNDYLTGKLKDTYNKLCCVDRFEELKNHGLVGIDTRFKNYMEEFVWSKSEVNMNNEISRLTDSLKKQKNDFANLQKAYKAQEHELKNLSKSLEFSCIHKSSFQALKNIVLQSLIKKNAFALIRTKQFERAKDIAQSIIANNPYMAWAYYILAKVQWHAGEQSEALENIGRAIILEPKTEYFTTFKNSCLSKLKK